MKLTTKQLKQIIKEELNKLVLKESGDWNSWLDSLGLSAKDRVRLTVSRGQLDLFKKLHREGFELLSRGPKAMKFHRITDSGDEQTVVYEGEGKKVLLYLAQNANPIVYDNALAAADPQSGISDDLNPSAMDFSNLLE